MRLLFLFFFLPPPPGSSRATGEQRDDHREHPVLGPERGVRMPLAPSLRRGGVCVSSPPEGYTVVDLFAREVVLSLAPFPHR